MQSLQFNTHPTADLRFLPLGAAAPLGAGGGSAGEAHATRASQEGRSQGRRPHGRVREAHVSPHRTVLALMERVPVALGRAGWPVLRRKEMGYSRERGGRAFGLAFIGRKALRAELGNRGQNRRIIGTHWLTKLRLDVARAPPETRGKVQVERACGEEGE